MKSQTSALRAARIAAAYKQIELAERAGVAVGTLHRLELYPAFKPSLATAEKLATAIQCKVEDLFPLLARKRGSLHRPEILA